LAAAATDGDTATIVGSTIVAMEVTWATKVLLTSVAVLLVAPVVGLRVQI
jgi:hypothetical protein